MIKLSTRQVRLGVWLYVATVIALSQPTLAMFNCFTPNMFNKGAPPMVYGSGPADRANWYPQQSAFGGYGQPNPMRMLFQPKWKMGSMFGQRGWNSWKMGNFYRPGYGYMQSVHLPPGVGAYGEQLNIPQSILNQYQQQQQQQPSTYYPTGGSTSGSNEGWSQPVTLSPFSPTTSLNNLYDSFTRTPAKQQIDPYGGTKGGSPARLTSTTKNLLVANGGYNAFDAYLNGFNGNSNNYNYGDSSYGSSRAKYATNKTFGYSYPEGYSGNFDSPARIAQQLLKHGIKQQQYLRLIQEPRLSSLTSGLLDEPRFVGFGSVDVLTGREARLSCSFGETIDRSNRPLWVKFLGNYNSSQIINGKSAPSFNCDSGSCRIQEVESFKDSRYKFEDGPATSSLIITEPRLSDYGTYRCSALTKATSNNPIETVYQIVTFKDVK